MAPVRTAAFALALLAAAIPVRAAEWLALEGRIPLPGVAGRIDHMAIDLSRKRLFIAEYGNGTVDVVGLASGRCIRRISGLREPQGVGYSAKADIVAVALGRDADNLRVDSGNGNLDPGTGAVAALAACADADDAYFDNKRRRLYVSCGAGVVDVFQRSPAGYRRVGQVTTARGARTLLFVPQRDRLYVAAPAPKGSAGAAILIFRPLP
ncbi:MAG TPA: hypothetical protein VJ770_25560 [Stellaceae bacterium]|nr:hypothetical protein [Stellaceae bacterium]